MNKARVIPAFLAVSLALIVLSCKTAPLCLAPSTTHIPRGAAVENLGHVSGSSSTWSLFGLWMWGRPDLADAVQQARESKNGDALINVTCYETERYYFLFTTTTVTVEGDAVKIIPEKTR